MSRPKIRLHVEHPLSEGQTVDLSREQANYLFAVMRLGQGAEVALFNGRDGEWRATVTDAGKRGGSLSVAEKTAPQQDPPDLWLLFAPIKKARTDFIVEKAAELGAARIMPVQTEFTNAERIRRDRLQAHAVEARNSAAGPTCPRSRTCGGCRTCCRTGPRTGPRLRGRGAGGRAEAALTAPDARKWAILIGPEGGFSEAERARLNALPFVTPISLGPRSCAPTPPPWPP
jgi:16S rRNA (uracil1498-N3)-methyltransferase